METNRGKWSSPEPAWLLAIFPVNPLPLLDYSNLCSFGRISTYQPTNNSINIISNLDHTVHDFK